MSSLWETPEYVPWSRRVPYKWQWHWGGGNHWAHKLIVISGFILSKLTHLFPSFKKGCPQLGVMIQRGDPWLDCSSWTTPYPPYSMVDHGFNHEGAGSLLCPVGVNWSDPEWVHSQLFCPCILIHIYMWSCGNKAVLKSSKMQVPGDQWPIFIYSKCEYDLEDPWKGAFWSALIHISMLDTLLPPDLSDVLLGI